MMQVKFPVLLRKPITEQGGKVMEKAILGTKIGMTQIFAEGGAVIPVTVIVAVRALSHRKRLLKQTATRLYR